MIALDTSALTAMLQNEPEKDAFFDRIADAATRKISAVTVLEAGIVMQARYGDAGVANLLDFLTFIEADVVPFDLDQAHLALEAYARFGKGMHTTARLNFGDCISYALAKAGNAPLLFKGDDFRATDVPAAV